MRKGVGGNGMKRFFGPAASAVVVLVVGLLGPAPAGGLQPDVFRITVDEVITITDCGFDVELSTVGFITVHQFFNEDGNLVEMEIANFSLTQTFSNPATGESITTRNVGPDITSVNQDGSFTVATIGLITNVIVQGQGKLAGFSGVIVSTFDAEGNLVDVVFEGGPHDDFLAAICAALA
jgi:hypothetical protein